MKTNILCVAAVCAAAAIGGCGPSVGFIVKPIPMDERLVENGIGCDSGLFVGDKIAVIELDGLIMNGRSGLLGMRENPVALFVEKVDRAQCDPAVKAVVLRINSPGGGVTASDIMHQRLAEFKCARKAPVVAIIEDVGASGGYYVACSADRILAHPTSITGSVGVIVQTLNFSGSLKMIGMQAQAVTSGPRKDMGSPFKPLDANDIKVLQGVVDDFYGRFLDVVASGRTKLTRERIKELADGRIYTGQQAKDNGLVDELGYMDDAIAMAKRLSGSSKVKVVMYARPWGYRENAYSPADSRGQPAPAQMNLVNINLPEIMGLEPEFMYLWTGHAAE